MRKFIEAKKAKIGTGSAEALPSSTAATPTSNEPAPIEPDARANDTTMEEAEADPRGQKRAADEASECAPKSSALPQQQQPAIVESTMSRGRRGPGLEPYDTPSEHRRACAAKALAGRRKGGQG